MPKYLVATANKITREMTFKHIEAESIDSVVIEEYIDSIIEQQGNVLWATYLPHIAEDYARDDFKKYVDYRLGNP